MKRRVYFRDIPVGVKFQKHTIYGELEDYTYLKTSPCEWNGIKCNASLFTKDEASFGTTIDDLTEVMADIKA